MICEIQIVFLNQRSDQLLHKLADMNVSEKFCLKWNDFSQNLFATFSDLKTDKDLVDVTLACGDGTHIEAHKVVLSAGSNFFKNILKIKKRETPIIYMRGLRSSELVAILDFLYLGEVNIPQEELNDFLSLAEELKLKGLEGGAGTKQEFGEQDPVENPKSKTKQMNRTEPNVSSKHAELKEMEIPTVYASLALAREEKYNESRQLIPMDQNEDLDRQLSELIQSIGDIWSCTVCGKQANKKSNLKKHIQLHIEGLSYACNNCDKVFRCKTNLTNHTYRLHKSV